MINPDHSVCQNKDPFLLALVISSAENFARRITIRQTWANKTLYPFMTTVFLVANTYNQSTNDLLLKESQEFADIVQEDFGESYDNLTLKSVMAFKWSAKYCQEAKLLMKIDDDVNANMAGLETYLSSVFSLTQPLVNTFMCRIVSIGGRIERDPSHKHHIPLEEYESNIHPTYCAGNIFLSFCFVNIKIN